MDFDFSTPAGVQKFITALVGIGSTVALAFGVAQSSIDNVVKIITILMPTILAIIFFIVNQTAAQGKAKAAQVAMDTKANLIKELAVSSPEVAIAIINANPTTQDIPGPAPIPVVLIKDKIKVARQTYGTWEGAKAMLTGTFKDRFEAALKRFASVSGTTIEAARLAVMEVAGVMLTDKECEMIGQQPGFLGALGANIDIHIIGDLLTAIDNTPELAYMKKSFTNRAVWYAIKGIVDEAVVRLYAGEGNAASRMVLQEFGYTPEQARNAQFSGAYPAGFDPWARVGIDPNTMQDI